MNKVTEYLWGRKLELEIVYDCFSDEDVTTQQTDSLNKFLGSWKNVEEGLLALRQYCSKDTDGSFISDTSEDIYKYVFPYRIFVLRELDDTVALMCHYSQDLEHGLAMLFEAGELTKIGSSDIAFI